MTPPLFRVDSIPAESSELVLDGPEGRHAGSSLRLGVGERFRAGDGSGAVADCEVTAAVPGRVTGEVTRIVHVPRPRPSVTVVQALPKSERSELAVELATEAGADRIVPWQARHCVSRWTGPKLVKGREKWKSAARTATKQSRRAHEPEIAEPASTADVAARVRDCVAGGGLACVLHEAAGRPLADVVGEWTVPGYPTGDLGTEHLGTDEFLIVVGPEGGVSEDEIARLTESGANPVVLGPEVLRTSTAAAVCLGALGVLTSRWESATASTLSDTGAGGNEQPGSDGSK